MGLQICSIVRNCSAPHIPQLPTQPPANIATGIPPNAVPPIPSALSICQLASQSSVASSSQTSLPPTPPSASNSSTPVVPSSSMPSSVTYARFTDCSGQPDYPSLPAMAHFTLDVSFSVCHHRCLHQVLHQLIPELKSYVKPTGKYPAKSARPSGSSIPTPHFLSNQRLPC